MSIFVIDEFNRSIDSEFYEDVFFLVLSIEFSGVFDLLCKRSFIYDFCEFLSILNVDEFFLRRWLFSVLFVLFKFSESELELNFVKIIGLLKLVGLSYGRENFLRL